MERFQNYFSTECVKCKHSPGIHRILDESSDKEGVWMMCERCYSIYERMSADERNAFRREHTPIYYIKPWRPPKPYATLDNREIPCLDIKFGDV